MWALGGIVDAGGGCGPSEGMCMVVGNSQGVLSWTYERAEGCCCVEELGQVSNWCQLTAERGTVCECAANCAASGLTDC